MQIADNAIQGWGNIKKTANGDYEKINKIRISKKRRKEYINVL